MITNLLGNNRPNSTEPDNLAATNSQTDNSTSKTSFDSLVPTATRPPSWAERVANYWQRMSLQRKATLLALAIGVIPIAAVGGIAHQLAARSLTRQIITDQENRTFELRQKVNFFTDKIISDANTIANSPLLNDPQLSSTASLEQKIAFLNDFIDARRDKYDSIVVFDMNGNLLFQSKSERPYNPQENYSNREYFQRAIATKAAAVNNPQLAASEGNSLEVAAPIEEQGTGKILGVVRIQMSLNSWKQIFQYVKAQGWEYSLIDPEGRIFLADEPELIGGSAGIDFVDVPMLEAHLANQKENGDRTNNNSASMVMEDLNDKEEVLVSLASIPNIQGVLSPGWKIALSRPTDEAFASLNQLRLALLLGSSAAALAVGAIAAALANRATLPILAAATAVKKIGRGDLDTQLDVRGQDELAFLGININKMADQLRVLVDYKAAETRRSQQLKDLTLQLSRAISSEEVFQIATKEILSALQAERVLIYRLEANGKGRIIAESVANNRASLLEAETSQLEYLDEYLTNNQSQEVRAIANIYQAELKVDRLQQLETIGVKAELVAPFATGKQFQYLSVVQQCSRTRQWQRVEIDFFIQLTSQIVLAWERTNLLQQQKAAKEQLQQRALELLMEVEPIGRGNLTTRATVTDDEIGTLADSYNSTVENLSQIVLQVQKSVTQMATTTESNEGFARSLSTKAAQQSEAIAAALDRVRAMAESIYTVAANAERAESTFQEVLQTVATGDAAMDRTVAGISAIRETVAETASKVKRLGESSQKISKVVNLIGSFAAQTNLLALNASLEASRAGEDERNFAMVADEIRALAQQSAAATNEIEKIVASIQLETREVVKAMAEGTERVVIGTKLVAETRQSLDRVATSSQQVNGWLVKIAHETEEESETSQKITRTITDVAEMASTISTDADRVTTATKELVSVAEELQASTDRFKVQ